MTTHLRIVLSIAIAVYFILIFKYIRQRTLLLKYALLWIMSGAIMALLVIFPRLLDIFIYIVGIQTPMYGLFIAVMSFTIIVLMSLTVIVSALNDKIKDLTQKMAMYEKRIRELEKNIGNDR